MVDIAIHGNGDYVPNREVAKRQGISLKYLEKLLTTLKQQGIIKSKRGPGGGHKLSRDAAQITVGDLVRALEGGTGLVRCLHGGTVCERKPECLMHGVWVKVEQAMFDELDSVTIADLVGTVDCCDDARV